MNLIIYPRNLHSKRAKTELFCFGVTNTVIKMRQNNNFCEFMIGIVDERHTLPVFVLYIYKHKRREREYAI